MSEGKRYTVALEPQASHTARGRFGVLNMKHLISGTGVRNCGAASVGNRKEYLVLSTELIR